MFTGHLLLVVLPLLASALNWAHGLPLDQLITADRVERHLARDNQVHIDRDIAFKTRAKRSSMCSAGRKCTSVVGDVTSSLWWLAKWMAVGYVVSAILHAYDLGPDKVKEKLAQFWQTTTARPLESNQTRSTEPPGNAPNWMLIWMVTLVALSIVAAGAVFYLLYGRRRLFVSYSEHKSGKAQEEEVDKEKSSSDADSETTRLGTRNKPHKLHNRYDSPRVEKRSDRKKRGRSTREESFTRSESSAQEQLSTPMHSSKHSRRSPRAQTMPVAYTTTAAADYASPLEGPNSQPGPIIATAQTAPSMLEPAMSSSPTPSVMQRIQGKSGKRSKSPQVYIPSFEQSPVPMLQQFQVHAIDGTVSATEQTPNVTTAKPKRKSRKTSKAPLSPLMVQQPSTDLPAQPVVKAMQVPLLYEQPEQAEIPITTRKSKRSKSK